MDIWMMGSPADEQPAQLRDQAAAGRANWDVTLASSARAAGRVALAAIVGAALTAAPLVAWAVWLRGR